MRERVTEVQHLPRPAVVGIAQANGRLERRAAADELRVGELPVRLSGKKRRLDDLGQPFAALFFGQRRQIGGVDQGARRPVERADEILAFGEVDRGLAADPRVHLADERRRHRDPVDSAEVGRRHEARDVRRAAAAEGDERPGAVEPELAPEPLRGADGLGLFAGGNCVQRRLERRRMKLEHA